MSYTNPDELSETVRELLGINKPPSPEDEARYASLKAEFERLKTEYQTLFRGRA